MSYNYADIGHRNLFLRIVREFIITLLIAVVIFIGLQISIKSFEVFNVSMLPTYREKDLIIVDKLAYVFGGSPHLGDEVVFYAPGSGPKPAFDPFFTQHPNCFIKRIIGVPGDNVVIKNNTVYINGRALSEPYVNEPPQYFMPERAIPEGQYFVLGDNRNHSNDSHTGWLVPREDIIGKVWFRYWQAEWPDIRIVMIPVFVIIVGTLIVVVIVDMVRSSKSGEGP
jgi:signal peptidase I